MPFGALVGNSTSGIQTGYFGGFSDEQAQGDVEMIQSSAFYYYPQYPEYSNLVGWSGHHEPESIQASGYHLSGCYYGYPSAMYQSSTGTVQPAAARSDEGGFQQQYFPHSGS